MILDHLPFVNFSFQTFSSVGPTQIFFKIHISLVTLAYLAIAVAFFLPSRLPPYIWSKYFLFPYNGNFKNFSGRYIQECTNLIWRNFILLLRFGLKKEVKQRKLVEAKESFSCACCCCCCCYDDVSHCYHFGAQNVHCSETPVPLPHDDGDEKKNGDAWRLGAAQYGSFESLPLPCLFYGRRRPGLM